MNNKKRNGISNPRINFIIDIFLLLVMALITGIGFLIYLVLVPGRVAREIYGRNVELNFLGLDRHQWGDVHLILAIILIVLLILHIIFHWKMIVGLYRKLTGAGTKMSILTTTFLLACLAFIIFPLFVTPQIGTSSYGNEHNVSLSQHGEITTHAEEELEIRGYMSLQEVSAALNTSTSKLKSALNIPLETNDNEKLGQLGRSYGFNPHDVKERLEKYLRE